MNDNPQGFKPGQIILTKNSKKNSRKFSPREYVCYDSTNDKYVCKSGKGNDNQLYSYSEAKPLPEDVPFTHKDILPEIMIDCMSFIPQKVDEEGIRYREKFYSYKTLAKLAKIKINGKWEPMHHGSEGSK